MHSDRRHQCLVYHGSPSLQLRSLARVMRQKLAQNHRCLYLNSPVMTAGMRSYLAAEGVDVLLETSRSSLIMSSTQNHLIEGKEFSVERLMDDLERGMKNALSAGYSGLWATGDMTWELGPDVGSGRLLEYEWRLERFMRDHPQLSGICQYHVDTLPMPDVRQGLACHAGVFVNETLSILNPHFVDAETFVDRKINNRELDAFLNSVLGQHSMDHAQ